jgi:hypothetical protein
MLKEIIHEKNFIDIFHIISVDFNLVQYLLQTDFQ